MLKQIVASILKLDYGEHNLHDKSLVCRSASNMVFFFARGLGAINTTDHMADDIVGSFGPNPNRAHSTSTWWWWWQWWRWQ